MSTNDGTRVGKLTRPKVVSEICANVLNNIDKERKRLRPTPDPGQSIGWIGRGMPAGSPDRWMYRVGIVTAILSPGVINAEIFGEPQKKLAANCQYIHHPENVVELSSEMGPGGGWFYLDVLKDENWQPPKDAFAQHQAALDLREQRCLQDELKRAEDQAKREAIAAGSIGAKEALAAAGR